MLLKGLKTLGEDLKLVASGGICTSKVNVKSAVRKHTLVPILVVGAVFFACFITLPIAGAAFESSFLGVQSDDSNTEAQLNTQGNVQENLQIHTYHLILVGHPTVTRVTVSLGQEVPNVDVLVEELEGKPAGAAEPFLPVRAYVSINVGEAGVENAAIEFKVPKSWVEQNNIDERTIKLLRLNSEWKELPTRLTRSSDLYFYFEAQTPGFSIFAVVGEKGPVAGPSLALYAAILMIAMAGGFSAVYWFLTRPMKPFISLKQLKRMVFRGKTKRPEESELEIANILKRLRSATKVKRAYRPPSSEEFKQKEPKFKRRHVSNKKDIERLRRLRRKMMGKS